MIVALGVGGWVAAVLLAACTVLSRRCHASRLEQIARASHELRGPLTTARLALELALRVGEIPLAGLRALEGELERATLALADLSSAMGGPRASRRLERLEMSAVVAACVEAQRAPAAQRGVQLRLLWSAGEANVVGDRVRLSQALTNLIGNAIEHGGGLVEVGGRIEAGAVRVEVTDGGPGLPAPVAELVGRARGGKGARGRGLAIAHQFARDHGGRVASAPSDRGARVTLELPLRSRGDLTRSA